MKSFLLVVTAAGTCGRGGMEEKKPVSSQLGENIKNKKRSVARFVRLSRVPQAREAAVEPIQRLCANEVISNLCKSTAGHCELCVQ